jgi:pyruvate kinase
MDRRAKIVATLGPASADPETFSELLDAGVDVVRLNLSHGTPEEHRRTLEMVREVAADAGRYIAVLIDLMGPRYRLGEISDGPLTLTAGELVTIGEEGSDAELPVGDTDLLDHLQVGERVLVDNGLLELRIESKRATVLQARVLTGGAVTSRKGINLPDSDLPFTISAKDRDDIRLAVEHDADYLAASYVGRAADVEAVRAEIERTGGQIPIVAKLERGRAVEHLEEIVATSEALMVARGDLGVEVPLRTVPVLQKKIVDAGRRAGKPVIVATQMLESMMERPRPTRAEASDVANAVLDGADALMLSGETAAGQFPVAAVRTMNQIIVEAEGYSRATRVDRSLPSLVDVLDLPHTLRPGRDETVNAELDTHFDIPDVIAAAAVFAARELGVRQIVAFSQGGFTARSIARYRPPAPILVLTTDDRIARRIQLFWGVRPILVETLAEHHDEVVEVVDARLVDSGLARPGETIIILMGDPISERPLTNLMRIHRVRRGEE